LRTEEVKKKASETIKGLYANGRVHPLLGKHHSEEAKEKMHNLTNLNRAYWTKFFQDLLSKKYGYSYSEDGKIIINLNSKGGLKC